MESEGEKETLEKKGRTQSKKRERDLHLPSMREVRMEEEKSY